MQRKPHYRQRKDAGIQDSAEVQERFQEGLEWVRPIAVRASIVTGFKGKENLDELEQLGRVGLLHAARRFDPARGAAFKSFAYARIRGAMLDGLGANAPLSRRVYERLGRTGEMDAHCAGMAAAERSNLVVHQNLEGDFVSGRSSVGAETHTDRERHRAAFAQALEDLSTLEHNVLGRHLEDHSVRDIGRQLGVSKDRAHRVLGRALEKVVGKLRG